MSQFSVKAVAMTFMADHQIKEDGGRGMTNKYTIWLSDWMLKQYPHTWQCPKAVNDAVGKLVIKILFAGGWWEE